MPEPLVDLGETPVANRLLASISAPEELFPLAVTMCERCFLVQLSWELPAAAIFDADYPYFSSFTNSVLAQAREHVTRLVDELSLNETSFVVEVGSNDGYLLQALREQRVKVLGVEPSPGPAAAAVERGVPTLRTFFGEEVAREIVAEHGRADVVVANNVMAHVPALNDFVAGLAVLCGDAGILTVENPSVVELVRRVQFDTIYHEHYCYFSCLSVRALLRRHGLALFRVEDLAAQGGSLRWWAAAGAEPEGSVAAHLQDERSAGIDRAATFTGLGRDVRRLQADLTSKLLDLHADGASLAAYGAAAKGATLLNTTGIGRELLGFVVDRNVHKQGLYMPGARLPILPVESLLERQPDVVLLLAWNVADEVMAQQAPYRQRGGRFLVPVPRPVLL